MKFAFRDFVNQKSVFLSQDRQTLPSKYASAKTYAAKVLLWIGKVLKSKIIVTYGASKGCLVLI